MGDPLDIDDSIGLDDNPLAANFRSTSMLRSREELEAEFPRQRRDLRCPDCGGFLILKDSKFGIFYGCESWHSTGCRGAHNCHKTTAEPLGFPANAETRALRKKAHEALDKLWKRADQDDRDERKAGRPLMDRRQAYDWLSKELEMRVGDTHISRFTKDQCLEVLRIVKRFTGENTRFDRVLEDD